MKTMANGTQNIDENLVAVLQLTVIDLSNIPVFVARYQNDLQQDHK